MSKKEFPPKEFADLIVSLYERSQDEGSNDSHEQYLKAVQQVIPSATKMTKMPFGFIYDESGKVYYTAVRADGAKLVIETFEIGVKGDTDD